MTRSFDVDTEILLLQSPTPSCIASSPSARTQATLRPSLRHRSPPIRIPIPIRRGVRCSGHAPAWWVVGPGENIPSARGTVARDARTGGGQARFLIRDEHRHHFAGAIKKTLTYAFDSPEFGSINVRQLGISDRGNKLMAPGIAHHYSYVPRSDALLDSTWTNDVLQDPHAAALRSSATSAIWVQHVPCGMIREEDTNTLDSEFVGVGRAEGSALGRLCEGLRDQTGKDGEAAEGSERVAGKGKARQGRNANLPPHTKENETGKRREGNERIERIGRAVDVARRAKEVTESRSITSFPILSYTSVSYIKPEPLSSSLDAGSVIPVAPIPAPISIDLRLQSPPRAVPRKAPSHLRQPQQHPFRGTHHRAREEKERVENRSPRGEDHLYASGAGSGIGLHRARRWWWEWEGCLVRCAACRRPAREDGYGRERRAESEERRACPISGVRRRARRGAETSCGGHGARERLCLISGRRPRSHRVCSSRKAKSAGRRDDDSEGVYSLDADAVITHIRAAPPEVVVVEEETGAGEEDVETRTPLHLRGASPAWSVPRPHPRPLPLPSILPSSRCPLPDMLFGFFACSSSAPCAMRQATRTSHDAR
ncbi:hypothetical protein B0H14DRAFT_3897891 [Mycena olivaceomarginata]|nr:hypothetical protein B0H14DRAFT_3897891 [Mycena olivaceomarginata]